MMILRTSLLLGVLATLATTSSAVVTSTFGTDAEGWRVVSYGPTVYTGTPTDFGVATYNMAGGNISSTDPDGGDFFFAAPSKFLGNALAAYGTNLTYDLADADGNDYNAAATVVLKGAGLVAAFNGTMLPGTSLTAFSVPLTEAGWTSDAYAGTPISQASFKAILASLTSIEIRGEYHVGGETSSLDNVTLQATPVPEPASFAALGLGLVALGRRRFRR